MTDFAEPVAPIEMPVADAALPKPVRSDWSEQSPAGSDWQRHGDGKAERAERRASISRAMEKAAGKQPDARPGYASKNALTHDGRVRDARRGAIEAARAKVEARYETKAERLGRATSDREVGSEAERRDTRGSVAKAEAKVGHVASRDESLASRSELRKAVDTLRQRYPGKSAADFVKIAKSWDAEFKADPVGTRERMLEGYAQVSPENFRDHVPTPTAKGVRGAIQRAARDSEDMASLAEFEKEFGNKLPAVLSELVRHDEAMTRDPVGTSARLAANYGAPVTPAQEAAYVQRQQHEHARQQQANIIHAGLGQIIERKLLPGLDDEKTLNAIADVLESKEFKRTGDRGKDLEMAHKVVMASRSKAPTNDAGTKSIHGAPSTPRAPREATGIRGSISRAKGRV